MTTAVNRPYLALSVTLAAYLALLLLFAGVVLEKPHLSSGSDYWMHAGSVALFSENLAAPRHTYDEPESIRIRNFSPYQLALATLVRGLGVTPNDAMAIGGAVSIAILFAGLWLVSTRFGENPWIPLGTLLAVLFFVGTGFSWSTEVDATFLPHTAGFPSTVAIGLSLFFWYSVDRLLRSFSWLWFSCIALLIALVFLVHQLVFVFVLTIVFLWALPLQVPLRNKLIPVAAIAVGIALTILWPYFTPFEVVFSALTGAEQRPDNVLAGDARSIRKEQLRGFLLPTQTFAALGPAILGIPLAFVLPPQLRIQLGLVVLVSTLMWWIPQLTPMGALVPTAGYRWAMLALLAMQLVIGCHLGAMFQAATNPDRTKRGPRLLYLGLAIVLGVTVVYQASRFGSSWGKYIWPPQNKTASEAKRWEFFRQEIEKLGLAGETIIADVDASYAMTSYQLNPVLFSRKRNPQNDLLLALFDQNTPRSERIHLINELGTPYFIVRKFHTPPSAQADFDAIAEKSIAKGGFFLYTLTAGSSVSPEG